MPMHKIVHTLQKILTNIVKWNYEHIVKMVETVYTFSVGKF